MINYYDKFPTYNFSFPKPEVSVNFVYNFFTKNEHLETQESYTDESNQTFSPAGYDGVPPANFDAIQSKIPRYVKIEIRMPDANIAFESKSIPWHTDRLPYDHQLNGYRPTVGRAMLSPEGRNDRLSLLPDIINRGAYNYEDSQSNPSMLNTEIKDNFIVDRIAMKSKVLAGLHEQNLNTAKGIKYLSDLFDDKTKASFVSINSPNNVPGVTTVNSIKKLKQGDFLSRGAALSLSSNISIHHALKFINSSINPSLKQQYIKEVLQNESGDLTFKDFISGHGIYFDSYEAQGGITHELGALGTLQYDQASFEYLDFSNEIPYIGYDKEPFFRSSCQAAPMTSLFSGDRFDYYLVGFRIRRTSNGLDTNSGTNRTFYVDAICRNVRQTAIEDREVEQTTFQLPGYYPSVDTSYTFIDTHVCYGESYTYDVEPVFAFMTMETNRLSSDQAMSFGQMAAQMDNTLQGQAAAALASGLSFIESGTEIETHNTLNQVFWIGKGKTDLIKCIDIVPPIHPSSLKFTMSRSNHRLCLRIKWQKSFSNQKDIKYYQIFRRESIDEAYKCIGMIDFNNATKPLPLYEFVEPGVVKKTLNSTNVYHDLKFKVNKGYYYSICAVDAHGLTSNYSSQFFVKYDTGLGKLVIRRISKPGAPKQYPNFFIDPEMHPDVVSNSLTQDYIGSSGKTRVTVYFDPDCRSAQINNREVSHWTNDGQPSEPRAVTNEIQKLIFKLYNTATDGINELEQGLYKIQLINTDRQAAESIEFRIINSEPPEEDERQGQEN